LLSFIIPTIVVALGLGLQKLNNRLGTLYTAFAVLGLFALFLAPVVKRFADGSYEVVVITGFGAFVLLVVYFVSANFRSFLSILAIACLVFPALFLSNEQIQKIVFAKENAGSSASQGLTVKSSPHIIMLVLDELPYISLLDASEKVDQHRFPNIAAFANDAHWFTNTTAVSDVTVFAVPAILSGLYPSQMKVPSTADYPDNIFTWLGDQRYQVNAIESATRLCPDRICTRTYTGSVGDRLALMFTDVAYVYLHIVLPESFATRLPDISQGWGGFENAARGARMDAFKNIDEWNAAIGASFQLDRMDLFDQFLNGIRKKDQPTFDFLHILFPHVPYEFFPNGKKYIPNDLPKLRKERWLNDESAPIQGYQRFLLQLGYLDKRIGELITHLKAIGIYDDSLIVITSDHGVSFQPGEGRRPISAKTTADILPVPLMIKEPGQKRGTTSNINVETVDVLPSVMDLLGVQPPTDLDGESVFRTDRHKLMTKRYYSFKAEMFVTVPEKVPGVSLALDRKMNLFGDGSDPFNLYGLGQYGEIAGKRLSDLHLGTLSPYLTAFDQSLMFNSISIENAYLPARLTGVISRDQELKDAIDMAVSINGVVAATFQSYSSEPDRFAVMIPGSMLVEGNNEVSFFSLGRVGDEIFLHPTEEMKEGLRTSWQITPLLIKEFESGLQTVFQMGTANLTAFKMLSDLSSSIDGDELVLHSGGNDPYLLLPEFPLQNGYWHIVRLKIDSPDHTQLQIYYLNAPGSHYNDEDTLIANLSPGDNEVYLKIWGTNTSGALRLDPGTVKGRYRLKELEVRSMKAPKGKQPGRITWGMYPRLQAEFEHSSAVVFQMTSATHSTFSALNELNLNSLDGQLHLTSSGKDPYLQLPGFTFLKGKEHLLKLVITSPEVTQLQIYYQTRQAVHYQDAKSIITNLRIGKNELYLSLGDDRFTGRIRLDPGMSAGEYVIHELEIRAK
jgi:hypothetical protein